MIGYAQAFEGLYGPKPIEGEIIMNQRIRELAEQANGPNPFYGTLKNQMTLLGDDAVEKFAELIVRECIEALDEADGSVHHSECLLEHFGVE